MGLKSNVWRGVSASAGLLLGLVFLLGNLAIDRQTDVNLFLGTTAPKTSGTGDALYFKSSYASAQEVVAAEKDHNIRMQEEASVLLKNKANALPLKSSERRVSLFGRAVADPVYRGQSGGAAFSGTSFHDALTGEGFAINETLFSAYQSSKTSRVTTSYEAVIAGSSPRSTIGEETSSFYTAALQASYATDYNDAAIVMFSRTAGEGKDLAKVDADGVAQLSLHQSEKDLLLMLKSSKDAGQIKKIIVLINSAFPMDLGFLEDDATYGVDAALSIGNPGNYGFIGVADILVGKADPSGHLADTYSANSLSSPAMQNFGDYTFSGMTGLYKNKYVVCAEGLYVGYKYYESRYADSVMARGNASGNYGVFAAGKTSWDYADEMVYPFGYGTSYASFQQTLKSLEWDRDAHQVKAVVNVKNVSSSTYSGKSKDVVELYVSLPYTEGGAEKSAIQLVDFAKSSALGVGEEEDITFTTSDYMFATYDNQATNGKDTSKKGCYTFDSGDYLFAIGSDAHDALNNTLSLAGYSGLKNADGTSVSGDSSLAKKVTLDVLDNVTYAVSPYTGAVVSNQFDDIDLNHFIPNKAPFFSRKDYASFPKETSTIDPSEEIKKLMENDNYTKPASSPEISAYKYGQTVTKKWIEMKDVPLSGEYTAKDGTKADGATSWDSFVDQLSVAELCQIAGEVMGNSAIVSVAYPSNTSGDGPDGIQGTAAHCLYVGEATAACSYSRELFAERGKLMGEDALLYGFGQIYGPGANLHRTPYGGRNFEYYSEEGNLAYSLARAQTNAMRDKGVLTGIKHFVGNDQETNRHGIATFMSEQGFRQNNLRCFEGALSNENSYGLMSSYNRIGCVPDASNYAVHTSVLRDEWGWKGVDLTDSSKDATSYIYTDEALHAGTNFFNNDSARSTDVRNLLTKTRDGHLWSQARSSAKYFFYAYLHTNVINGLTAETAVASFVPWWIPTVKALQYGLLGITVVSLSLLGVSLFLEKKKGAVTSSEGK